MANLGQIEKQLKKLGIDYKIIDLGGEIFRVEDVIRAGVNPDGVVKTLLVRSKPTIGSLVSPVKGPIRLQNIERLSNKMLFCALVIRGGDRLNFKKVKKLLGPSAELAKPEEVKKVVGVPLGAVCPIEIAVPLYFDPKVMELESVNLGSGDLTRGLDMKMADLLRAVGEHKIIDVV